MPIFKILSSNRYLALSLFFTILTLFYYPFFQVLPQGLHNFWFWFSLLSVLGWFLYISYSVLLSVTISFFVFRWRQKTCSTPIKFGSGFLGSVGAFLGFFIPQCVACLSIVSVLLPLSLFSFFAVYATEVMLASIFLLLFSLWILGAFTRVKVVKKHGE